MKELPKFLIGQSNHTLPTLMRLVDLNILPVTNVEWAEKTTEILLSEIKVTEFIDFATIILLNCFKCLYNLGESN